MIEFEISIDVPEEFGDAAARAYVRSVVSQAADLAFAETLRLAHSELGTTARAYANGLQPPRMVSDDTAVIELLGTLPVMVEEGWGGGDLRQTVLKNHPKKRVAKDGHIYAFVPFRHGASKSGGKNTGASMPSGVHKAAKGLAPTLTAPFIKVQKYGGRLPAGTAGSKPAKPHHKTDLYASMYRQVKIYEDEQPQAQYVTFRAISEAVKTGWHHGGIEARGLLKRGGEYAIKTSGLMVDENPIEFGGE